MERRFNRGEGAGQTIRIKERIACASEAMDTQWIANGMPLRALRPDIGIEFAGRQLQAILLQVAHHPEQRPAQRCNGDRVFEEKPQMATTSAGLKGCREPMLTECIAEAEQLTRCHLLVDIEAG